MAHNEIEIVDQNETEGSAEAKLAFGLECAARGDTQNARASLLSAGKLGSAPALRELAKNLLSRTPVIPKSGFNFMRAAADKGDAEASYYCGILAAYSPMMADRWPSAVRWLQIASDKGFDRARKQLEFLHADLPDLAELTHALKAKTMFEAPRIRIVENFLPSGICDWLIGQSRPHLSRALVFERASGPYTRSDVRTNTSHCFGLLQSDLVVALVRQRIAATIGLGFAGLEPTAVLHYAVGEQYKPHFDFLSPSSPSDARDIAENGQRVATFLVYLNDDFEGGETAFTQLDWRYRGRKGDALFFWNVDEIEVPDTNTQHAGLPPTSGEKWLLSQWIRRRR